MTDQEILERAEKHANLSHEDFDGSIDNHFQTGFFQGAKYILSQQLDKAVGNHCIVDYDNLLRENEDLKVWIKSIYEMLVINIPYYAYGDHEAACELANQINHTREFIVHEIIPAFEQSLPNKVSE